MKTLIKKELFDGKFDIQGQIGKGQTGTILYGYDLGLRQEVAIKIYHSHINGRLIRGKAFVEKSQPLLRIDHPNLIKVFKVEEGNNSAVVFMEFFDAPSLQQLIHDKGPLPVQDMLLLAREITEVLVHTHFQGIIHGTLHPGHVLVGLQGQIKVLDLGLSWILMDILVESDPDLLRPLPYFPPEIAKGELLNVSSDLYSLGFMMYEMLTGAAPYAGLPKTSIMGKLAFDQADPILNFPDTVPEAICDLIINMTRNKSQQRLQDATHVLTIINQQLTKLPLINKSIFLSSVVHPTQAHAPKVENETQTAPTTSAMTEDENPEPKKTSPIQRPQTSVDYRNVKESSVLRNISITLGLLVLVGLAGALGYWYRDVLEPHFSILQEQPEHSPKASPIEKESLPTSTQDSTNKQEPLSVTEKLPQKALSPLSPHKEIKPNTSPTTPAGQPNRSNNTPVPKTEKAKQGQSLVSAPNPSDSKQAPVPKVKQSSKIPPAAQEKVPSQSTNDIKRTSVQKSKLPQPKETTAKQGTSPIPSQKQPAPEKSHASVKNKISKEITENSEVTPVSSTHIPTKGPAQKVMPQKPTTKKAKPEQASIPSKRPFVSNTASPPIAKEFSKTTAPGITPQPTSKETRAKPLKSPVSIAPASETIILKKKSTASPTPLGGSNQEPTDEEIEEILKSMEAATENPSLITEP